MAKRAVCDACGGDVWFDAWVDIDGNLAGGPYDNTWCETCEGEASFEVVEENSDSGQEVNNEVREG